MPVFLAARCHDSALTLDVVMTHPPRRVFLARVVPVAYVLALVVTSVVASTGVGLHSAMRSPSVVGLDAGVPTASGSWPKARERQTQRRVRMAAVRRIGRRKATMRSRVEWVFRPAVSRSSQRLAPKPPPSAALVLHIVAVATPDTMQSAIDACDGPVEINWHSDPARWGVHPDEIAEHDYCGGSQFRFLRRGQRVRVMGGDLSGVYVANGNRRFAFAGSPAHELDGIGDLALQTCVRGGVVLIGLDRVD